MTPAAADTLDAFVKGLRKRAAKDGQLATETQGGACWPNEHPLLGRLIVSMLVWEATESLAAHAVARLSETIVDANELRVCLPDELTDILGPKYPRVEERVLRIRAMLLDVYKREHTLSLDRVAGLGKREARAFFDSLEGVPPYCAARAMLLGLGAHAAPVDERWLMLLREDGAMDEDATVASARSALERAIRASEMPEVFTLVELELDRRGAAPAGKSKRGKASKKAAQNSSKKSKSNTGAKRSTSKAKSPKRSRGQ